MTWVEFKKQVEEQGVTDDMEVDYIDITEMDEEARVDIHIPKNSFSVW